MKSKGRNIFWGVLLILAAAYLVVSQLGLLPEVSVMKVLMTMFCIALIIDGIRYLNFYQILFPIAFIGCIYDKVLGITRITPWTLLTAALLGSIGLTMLFGKKKHHYNVQWEGYNGTSGVNGNTGKSSEQCNEEQVCCENNFGSAIRYVNSDNFKNAHLENNFGSMSIYFDNAIIQDGSAYVNVENNFGETNLYIPKEWKVQNNLDRAFGGVHEKGRYEGTSNTILYINGSANFGVINIHYV